MDAKNKSTIIGIKRKPVPQIRQTRTSAYRILKANPLMMHDQESIKKMGFQDLNNIPKSVDILGISFKNDDSKSNSSSTLNLTKLKRNNDVSVNNSALQKLKPNNPNTCALNDNTRNNDRYFIKPSTIRKGKIISNITRPRQSTEHFKINKCVDKKMFNQVATNLEAIHSADNAQNKSKINGDILSCEKQTAILKTHTASNQHNAAYYSGLQRQLNNWLAKRGKSLGSYRHLMCFGINKEIVNSPKQSNENLEYKENIDIKLENDKNYENMKNCGNLEQITEETENPDYKLLARDALYDLNQLIRDGYPSNQCEAWLCKIREKYQHLEDEPLYWECRAALEQCKGNISTAVDHYRKAIVNGAEVQRIEESLDHLLYKFGLLHIDPESSKDNTKNRRVTLDARNVFKSTIIQFAVQERAMKRKEDNQKKHIFVTPVRRSARLSYAPQSCTPTLKLCTTLKEVDLNENTEFKTNNYLSIRYTPK